MQTAVADIDLAQAGPLGNALLSRLSALRDADPIHWSEASDCWIVTRHEDVLAGFSGELPLSARRLTQTTFARIPEEKRERLYPNLARYIQTWSIDLDPPEHTRLRKLMVTAFNKKVIDNTRPFIRQRVADLMDILERRPTIEFGEEIGRQLPGSVILKLLGVAQDYLPMLRDWSNAIQQGVANPGLGSEELRKAEIAIVEMNRLFEREIEVRRAQPGSDLITALVQASDEGDRLSIDEVLGACQLVIVAGHDTTHNSLSLGLATLARDPVFWDYMYRNPEKTLECVLELMRHMAMSATQPRIVSEDFAWHGKLLKKGQVVFLMMAAGNRDPRVFDNPEELSPGRNNDQSLVFAPGVHHCVGHLLAKAQLCEFFSEMVKRFEGAELLDANLDFMPQIVFRGLNKLNVRMKLRV